MERTSVSAPAGASLRGRSRDSSRGQSLVEFAIFLPILLVILLIAVDFGRVFMGLVSVNNMARIGANYASITPTAWQSPDSTLKAQQRARYQTLMQADATAINCTLPASLPAPVFSSTSLGSYVRVDLSCDFSLLTPFLSSLIGDGAGQVPVSGEATFAIRTGSVSGAGLGGGGLPTPEATPTPPPSETPTATPTGSPDPDATPTPTPDPVTVDFYGTPTSADSEGGGAPGTEGEGQIVGIPNLSVIFSNTTTGTMGSCLWQFGDGTTSTSCGSTVNKTYSTRGTYHVSLTVNAQSHTRTAYVLVGCKVPSFAGVRKNSASGVWTNEGFTAANLTALNDGNNSNYVISYQDLAGGMVNPPGGCSGATVTVGP